MEIFHVKEEQFVIYYIYLGPNKEACAAFIAYNNIHVQVIL